jgi:hypothetical protein
MMRRLVSAALVLASACKGGGASEAQQFDGVQAHRWVEHMVQAGPRIPNTPAHRTVGDWLISELRARADTVLVQEWVHVTRDGDSLHLRNIFARFKPADPNRVLYVSHWDSKPHATMDPDPAKRGDPVPGANDGASSTAMLLGVADELKRRPPAMGVDLLFVDGEDYGNFEDEYPDNVIGARYFASHMPAGYRPLFAVLWDMIGDYDQQFPQEGYSRQNAPEVVDRVWGTARDLGLGRVFLNRSRDPVTDDHVPLQQAGLRIVDVIDCCNENYAYWHTTLDTPDKVSPQSLANAGRVAVALVR